MAPKIKFGIIGCSRISQRSVIPSIMKSQNAEIEMIGSRSLEKAKEFSNKFSCKKFGSYDDVISDESIDIVYISTPIGTHEEWVIKAASAGKHVLCEKPLAPTPNDIRQMIEARDKSGKMLMTAQHFRYQGSAMAMKAELDTGALGQIYHARSWMLRRAGAPTGGHLGGFDLCTFSTLNRAGTMPHSATCIRQQRCCAG